MNDQSQRDKASQALHKLAAAHGRTETVTKQQEQRLFLAGIALVSVLVGIAYNDYRVAVAEVTPGANDMPFLSFFAPGVLTVLDLFISSAVFLVLINKKKQMIDKERAEEKKTVFQVKNNTFLYKRLTKLEEDVGCCLNRKEFNLNILVAAAWFCRVNLVTKQQPDLLLNMDNSESSVWILESGSAEVVKELQQLSDSDRSKPLLAYSAFAHRSLGYMLGVDQSGVKKRIANDCSNIIRYSEDRVRLERAKYKYADGKRLLGISTNVFRFFLIVSLCLPLLLFAHNMFSVAKNPELRDLHDNFFTAASQLNNFLPVYQACLTLFVGSLVLFMGTKMRIKKDYGSSKATVDKLTKSFEQYPCFYNNSLLSRLCEHLAKEPGSFTSTLEC